MSEPGIWWDGVEYRDVVGFPGYKVGDDGTVWTCWMPRGGHLPGGRCIGGMKMGSKWKLLKQRQLGGNMNWAVHLSRSGKTFNKFVSRLVLEAFVGPAPEGMICRHGPRGKHCNHLSNLQWGTQKDNIADKYRDGTRVFGVRHHEAKMTPEAVRAAREEHAAGASGASLAKKYGVAQTTMNHILRRIWWKDVV